MCGYDPGKLCRILSGKRRVFPLTLPGLLADSSYKPTRWYTTMVLCSCYYIHCGSLSITFKDFFFFTDPSTLRQKKCSMSKFKHTMSVHECSVSFVSVVLISLPYTKRKLPRFSRKARKVNQGFMQLFSGFLLKSPL